MKRIFGIILLAALIICTALQSLPVSAKETAPEAPSPIPVTDEVTEAPVSEGGGSVILPGVLALLGIAAAVATIVCKKLRLPLFIAAGVLLILAAVFFATALFTGGETPPEGGTEQTDADYDPYAIHFEASFDPEKPHVVFSDVPTENGISVSTPDGSARRHIEYKGKDSWILERDNTVDSGSLVFTLDGEAAAEYEPDGESLVLYYFCDNVSSLAVSFGEDGAEREIVLGYTGRWAKAIIPLDGFDPSGDEASRKISVKIKGFAFVRVWAAVLTKTDKTVYSNQPELIVPKYGNQTYIVADINVKFFGAVGDGRTDDTLAFKSALTYVNSIGGGTVFVPEGHYALTDFLEIPTGCMLIGELECGTVNGTVICAYAGKNDRAARSLFSLNMSSSVKNLAVWYPEQEFIDGEPIYYPYTFEQLGTEAINIENVTLVNSYNGVDLLTHNNNALQQIRYLSGTVLNIGIINDKSLDIGRMENITFSPDYWLNSGLEGIPNETQLRNYMLTHAVGMTVRRVDWTYYTDISITGNYIGIKYEESDKGTELGGTANGHVYNLTLTDCFYGVYVDKINDIGIILSNCNITTAGKEGSVAVYCTDNFNSDIAINTSHIESEGKYAIYNAGSGFVSLADCTVKSADTMYLPEDGYTFINVTLDMPDKGDYTSVNGEIPALAGTIAAYGGGGDYNRYVETKPTSTSLVNISKPPYNIKAGGEDDISAQLQAAIDSLKDTGGIVYLPAGRYYLEQPITVHAGIELRGPMDAPHFGGVDSAKFLTDYGYHMDAKAEALITLNEGCGMRGINITYYKQNASDIQPYAYTIRGKGSGIYLANMWINTAYDMIDFSTYRCDEHFIDHIWGAPAHYGISVGSGSENGIIRDCHLTPNVWSAGGAMVWEDAWAYIMLHGEQYVIGESTGELLYHNFTYASYRGITLLDGARSVLAVGHGVDSGNFAVYAEGDCDALFVNAQLVNLKGREMNYIYTDDSFEGKLTFLNVNMWGTPNKSIVQNGSGSLTVVQGAILSCGETFLTLNGGEALIAGIHVKPRAVLADIRLAADTKATLIGNVFGSGGRFKVDDDAILID